MHSVPTQLPAGWRAAFDNHYQRWYYVHAASGTSQWELPDRAQQQQQQEHHTDAAQPEAARPADTAGTPVAADVAPVAGPAAAVALESGDKPKLQQQQKQQQEHGDGSSMYCYHDLQGQLMGPFSVEQLRGWRPYLPMDLILLPQQQAQQAQRSAGGAAAPDTAAVGEDCAESSVEGRRPAAAAATPANTAAGSKAEVDAGAGAVIEQETDAQSPAADAGPVAEAAAAAGVADIAVSNKPESPAAADPSSSPQNSGSRHTADPLYLADLLGDAQLLRHFQASRQQHQPQTQTQMQQQQQAPVVPPKAVAPPAPVWQAWVAQHTNTATSGPAPATAAGAVRTASPGLPAAAAWYLQHQQHRQHYQHLPELQQQQQHTLGLVGLPAATGGSNSSSTGAAGTKSSSFDKYAAAVLQGLPPEDEAVQLAQLAAVHGYSLSDVLQQQQGQPGSTAGGLGVTDVMRAGGITVTPEGVSALLVKDPRSGRLSVAPGSSGGSNGGSSAAELYGDLARWCDPASLERMLQRKRQQQGSAGGGGAAKRTR